MVVVVFEPTLAAGVSHTERHPFLFFNEEDIIGLKERASTTPGYKAAMAAVAREALKKKFSAYGELPVEESYFVNLAEVLPFLAMRALLSGKDSESRDILERAEKVADYTHWGKGEHADRGLEASNMLFGLVCVYDWLYTSLPENVRVKLATKIADQAELLYKASAGGKQAWWATTYNQNHNQQNHTALFAAGILLRDEIPDAKKWIERSIENFDFYFKLKEQATDGSEAECSGYAALGQHFVIIYVELLARHFDKNLYETSAWLRNLPRFYAATAFPGFAHSDGFGDSRYNYYVFPTHILHALDSAYGTGHGAWLADRIVEGDKGYYRRIKSLPFELIFRDAGIKPEKPDFADGLQVFPDWGTAFYKDSVEKGSLFTGFKCSAPGGKAFWDLRLSGDKTMKRHNVGHCHPDANSFFLHPGGKMFLTDSGYEIPKATENHNTLLFDGIGQEGEGNTWFGTVALAGKKRAGKLVAAASSGGFVLFAGEASDAYPDETGLTDFFRQVLVFPGGAALIYDTVNLERKRKVTHCFNSIRNRFEGGDCKAHVVIAGERFTLKRVYPEEGEFEEDGFRNRKIGVNVGRVKVDTQCPVGKTRFLHAAYADKSPVTAMILKPGSSGGISVEFSYSGEKHNWRPASPSRERAGLNINTKTGGDAFSTLSCITSRMDIVFPCLSDSSIMEITGKEK